MAKFVTIIKPVMIRWARNRLKLSIEEFATKMRVSSQRVVEWEEGTTAITMNQAQLMASLTLLPLGVFFLQTPPNIDLELPDFRSVENTLITNASPELEATILAMQEKQTWYKEYLIENGEPPLSLVGSISLKTAIKEAAQKITKLLDFSIEEMAGITNWSTYMDLLVDKVESAGILFVRNGVVGNNTSRPLDVEEFRGFVLVDNYAPLIFINGKDSKNAQLFTLIHEIAHLLLGKGGIIDANMFKTSENTIERYCNKVAAEFLAPEKSFRADFEKMAHSQIDNLISELAKKYRVSKFVVIARCRELNLLSKQETTSLWQKEVQFLQKQKDNQKPNGGGDFFATLKYRVGQLFAQTIISEVMASKLSYSDAYHLLNVKGHGDLVKLSHVIGVPCP